MTNNWKTVLCWPYHKERIVNIGVLDERSEHEICELLIHSIQQVFIEEHMCVGLGLPVCPGTYVASKQEMNKCHRTGELGLGFQNVFRTTARAIVQNGVCNKIK